MRVFYRTVIIKNDFSSICQIYCHRLTTSCFHFGYFIRRFTYTRKIIISEDQCDHGCSPNNSTDNISHKMTVFRSFIYILLIYDFLQFAIYIRNRHSGFQHTTLYCCKYLKTFLYFLIILQHRNFLF